MATGGAGRVVTMFIALSSGKGCRTPKDAITRPAPAPAAFSVSRARTSKLSPVASSRTRIPVMRRPSRSGSSASA